MEHIQHISGTLQEHLQNTYGIFMAMLNKIINHFYTILLFDGLILAYASYFVNIFD